MFWGCRVVIKLLGAAVAALPAPLAAEISGKLGGDGLAVEVEEAVAAGRQIQPCHILQQMAVSQCLIAKIIIGADQQDWLGDRGQICHYVMVEDSAKAPREAVSG